MEAWWKSLSERERYMVIYGAIAVAIFLFYYVFWAPLNASIDALRKSNDQTRELITWMKNAEAEVRQVGQQANTPASKISLLTAIEQSVKRDHVNSPAPEIKQLDQSRVQVTFATVEFIAVVRWLQDVQATAGGKIEKVSMSRTDKQGIVHADITLSR